ncbi:MAG: D-alanine--D-alanine ligase [Bacteroidales bacterium]|nr:D-alanine--D-alanine ligase [Bacteroidales bacterium]
MKKNIAILAGGDSSESVISLKSAEQVRSILDKEKFNLFTVYVKGSEWVLTSDEYCDMIVNKDDFSFTYQGTKIKFDFALIMIHGTPGEDGKLQSYFDILKIPYSSPNAFSSALTFNKIACKAFLKNYNVNMAESLLIRQGQSYDEKLIIEKVGIPCFVKPNAGGSSFGTSKVKRAEDLKTAIEFAFKEDNEVIIESFIDGVEVSNGVYISKNNYYRLPVTEIDTDNEFFDYDAKYSGKTREITPARLSDSLMEEIKDQTKLIYEVLNCKGIVRVDYIVQNNVPYFLEINTVPGMSSESIVPKQVRFMNLNLSDLFTELIQDEI